MPIDVLRPQSLAAAAALALALVANTQAAPVSVKVRAENLVTANGITFAPLRLGFGNGSFDAFNQGGVATAPIVSVAEGGSGADWFPAFAAAEPNAVTGTVVNGGPLLPGAMAMNSFMVDPSVNRYFTFASMVVPSNDFFIGNDSPMEYELFSAGGALQIASITLKANEIWDAGSEILDPAAAAFLLIGNNDLRRAQNSVVNFNFAELAAFNGLTTAAGYVFDSQLAGDTDVYRISFEVARVPEPGTHALMLAGLVAMGGLARRRRPN